MPATGWFKPSHVAALPTVKANWFTTLTMKRWEIMINNDIVFCDQRGNTLWAAPTLPKSTIQETLSHCGFVCHTSKCKKKMLFKFVPSVPLNFWWCTVDCQLTVGGMGVCGWQIERNRVAISAAGVMIKTSTGLSQKLNTEVSWAERSTKMSSVWNGSRG